MRNLRTAGLLVGALFGAMAAVAAALKLSRHSVGGPASDELDLVTIWTGSELVSEATAFRGAELLTWWGGTRLDLRKAQLDAAGANLHMRTLFGGIEVVVPEGWQIDSDVFAFAGGVDRPEGNHPGGPLLRLSGWVAFGGVSVSHS